MSIKVMSAVWANGPDSKTELLVLLALADNADDQGKCWPSYATIARKSRITRRHVIRIISKLCKDGYIKKKKRMQNQEQTSNIYMINIEKLGGDTVSLVTDNVTTPSDNGDTPLVTTVTPEPSVNHNIETSIPDELKTDIFIAVWKEWKEYRKEMRKPLKPTTIKRQFARLKKYSSETAAAMLVQSIENQWQGIFELKDGRVANKRDVKVQPDGSINV